MVPSSVKDLANNECMSLHQRIFFSDCCAPTLLTPAAHPFSLLNSLPPSPSQLASFLHFLIPSCFSVGPQILLMTVVLAHGAAPSQLDAAQPSHTSNQSKEQSIACGPMFIKATDIHLRTSYCTPLQWLTCTASAPAFFVLPGCGNEKEGD